MRAIRIGVDYSNICQDYNTAYLDRDNKDPETSRCMKQVTAWMHGLLSDLCRQFGYTVYNLHSATPVKVEEVASNRFLFYSLEKEITLQSFVLQDVATAYESVSDWADKGAKGVVVSNDEDGEGVYFLVAKEGDEYRWLLERLKSMSLEETPL
jgi:hypothetical protein